ncbi:MAG: histidine triad nucleotide-binding protein [Gemmatimonadaceae bacterium]
MAIDCLFCRIVGGEIPATLVADNSYCIAFRDISPQSPTHVLVVPRLHFDSLDDITDSKIIGEVMMMAAEVARSEKIANSGYRVVLNTGSDGGQSVSHLHAHVMGGRSFRWPPG